MNTKSFIKIEKFKKALNKFNLIKPFPFTIIDNFLNIKLAKKIEKNFPLHSDKKLWTYKNYCEIKKATDNWNMFPPEAYQLLSVVNLNPHLDYIIHPKLNLMRKFNLIIFFNTKWKSSNGGELCLYEKNPNNKNLPGKLVKKIEPKFNRAVLFDTSLNSWHGVNEVKSMIRKSMAVYYLIDKKPKIERRYKALY